MELVSGVELSFLTGNVKDICCWSRLRRLKVCRLWCVGGDCMVTSNQWLMTSRLMTNIHICTGNIALTEFISGGIIFWSFLIILLWQLPLIKVQLFFHFLLILKFSKFQMSKTIKNHQKEFWFRKNFKVGLIIISLTLLPVWPKKMVCFEPRWLLSTTRFWSKLTGLLKVSRNSVVRFQRTGDWGRPKEPLNPYTRPNFTKSYSQLSEKVKTFCTCT